MIGKISSLVLLFLLLNISTYSQNKSSFYATNYSINNPITNKQELIEEEIVVTIDVNLNIITLKTAKSTLAYSIEKLSEIQTPSGEKRIVFELNEVNGMSTLMQYTKEKGWAFVVSPKDFKTEKSIVIYPAIQIK